MKTDPLNKGEGSFSQEVEFESKESLVFDSIESLKSNPLLKRRMKNSQAT
jgi:hypothetical protein